uniref:Putative secreted protein n=1 Tax=Anopheles darlingi TaxID=43151 RepID=A0A2M4DNN4_ANODA
MSSCACGSTCTLGLALLCRLRERTSAVVLLGTKKQKLKPFNRNLSNCSSELIMVKSRFGCWYKNARATIPPPAGHAH